VKYILLIGDGMGDVPLERLAGRTPLEAASTPFMDRLARGGELLTVRTVPRGYPPGSDVANLSLLGYEPELYYTGRAPLEAASMGVRLGPDDLAFRCNLVTVERGADGSLVMIDYSAGHISTPESHRLVRAIAEACASDRVRFHAGVSYRHLLVHRGGLEGLRTVPPHDHLDQDVTAFYREYARFPHLARVVDRAAEVLAGHPVNRDRCRRGERPANFIWLWGEGKSPAMEPMRQRYGIGGSLISAVDLLKGLAVCLGLRVVEVEGATGYLDTNYAGKAAAALAALAGDDLVVVHVEAPDEAGHQGSLEDKVRAIEDFDARIVGPILTGMEERREPFRLVVTMDHYTPLERRTHESWPVPLVLYDSRGVARPSGRPYSEAEVAAAVERGGPALESGPEFFHRFLGRS